MNDRSAAVSAYGGRLYYPSLLASDTVTCRRGATVVDAAVAARRLGYKLFTAIIPSLLMSTSRRRPLFHHYEYAFTGLIVC